MDGIQWAAQSNDNKKKPANLLSSFLYSSNICNYQRGICVDLHLQTGHQISHSVQVIALSLKTVCWHMYKSYVKESFLKNEKTQGFFLFSNWKYEIVAFFSWVQALLLRWHHWPVKQLVNHHCSQHRKVLTIIQWIA